MEMEKRLKVYQEKRGIQEGAGRSKKKAKQTQKKKKKRDARTKCQFLAKLASKQKQNWKRENEKKCSPER